MIRINLAAGRGKGAKVSSADPANMGSIEGGEMSALRSIAIKRLFVILLGPILLYVYEQQTVPAITSTVQKKSASLMELQDKNSKAAEAVEQIKKFKTEQGVLQAQINSIEGLKKDRLREVKVLDFIQKDLPEKLWLSRMELNDGRLTLQGMVTTDSELTQFMDSLSRSAYLKEVSLIRSSEEASRLYGAVKKFEISCLMEKTP